VQNYFTQKFFRGDISRFSASLFLATALAVLAGCGAGQAIPTVPLPANAATTGPIAATIQLLASTTQMPSSGAATVDLKAIVLDAAKQTVSGKTVTFSTGTTVTETAYLSDKSADGVSDSNGVVTAKLNLGTNKANRTISISATVTADSATTTNSVDVTGTTVTMSGSSSLAFGASTTLTFSVKDSAGAALQGITLTVTSTKGNTVTPASGTTNSSGQVQAVVTATQTGSDTITATAAGASATQTLTVSSASFAFTAPTLVAPATTIDIPLNTATAVSINWKNAGAAVVGSAVSFAASRGTITGSPVNTNASGDTPGVTISSSTAGPAIITASGPGSTPAATLDVIFVATTASSAVLQANPGTVAFTTGSTAQTNNSSTITVQVRDAANNLVKNASVSFTLSDISGGKLTAQSGTTDVSGSASVTYVAGGTSSAQNGVTVTATVTHVNNVPIAAVTASTTLTVAAKSVQVRLSTDNKVGGTTPLNTRTYVAVVTDSGGNPIVGTTVQFVLRPGRYRKGTFVQDAVNKVWVQAISATCPNEDLNFNGSLDPGEGLVTWPAGTAVPNPLLPGAVASVNATGTTDTAGFATATITYGKSQSFWVEMTLEARTAVTSNDPPTHDNFFLPGLAADYTDLAVNPPGRPSPYGVNASCADTL
jgi:hypothetical protein